MREEQQVNMLLVINTISEPHACEGCLNVKKNLSACVIKPLFINVPTAAGMEISN